ncbi:hypothetical protein AVEN_178007-1 [Araneus ventricosus]|uniref:Uncharacterized protein n=1 Tax=Araneus ventricosus TaxID=182803 RepID=A0A4Y2K303_ARAVE|nr:hypothetical protein AVEN_178007-1 [Araneus ventricosus]
MVAFRSSYSSSPTLRISDFIASTRGPNVARSFALPLASQRGPQKAIRPFQSDFKLFGIPPLPFPLCQFSSVFKTDDWFSLPVLKYFQSGAKNQGRSHHPLLLRFHNSWKLWPQNVRRSPPRNPFYPMRSAKGSCPLRNIHAPGRQEISWVGKRLISDVASRTPPEYIPHYSTLDRNQGSPLLAASRECSNFFPSRDGRSGIFTL